MVPALRGAWSLANMPPCTASCKIKMSYRNFNRIHCKQLTWCGHREWEIDFVQRHARFLLEFSSAQWVQGRLVGSETVKWPITPTMAGRRNRYRSWWVDHLKLRRSFSPIPHTCTEWSTSYKWKMKDRLRWSQPPSSFDNTCQWNGDRCPHGRSLWHHPLLSEISFVN